MSREKHVQSSFQFILVDLVVQILDVEPTLALEACAHKRSGRLTSGWASLRSGSLCPLMLESSSTTWRVRRMHAKGRARTTEQNSGLPIYHHSENLTELRHTHDHIELHSTKSPNPASEKFILAFTYRVQRLYTLLYQTAL